MILTILWAQRGYVLAVAAAGTFWTGLQAFIPVIVGHAIDDGIRNNSWAHLGIWLATIAAIGVGLAAAFVIRHRLALGIHIRTQSWMERIVGARALHVQGGLDGLVTPGELVSHASVDARRVSQIDIVGRLTGAVCAFSFVLNAMFRASASLAIVVLVGLLPLLIVLLWRLHVLERLTRAQQATLSAASSWAADAISGVRIVKGVGGETEAVRRYDDHADNIMQASLRSADVRSQTLALDLMMPIIVVTAVAWFGGHQVLDGRLSIGQLVTFSGWSIFLVTPLLTFGEAGRKLAMALSGAARIVDLLALPPDISDDGDKVLLDQRGDVKLNDVTVVRDGVAVLDHLTVAFVPSVMTAVIADAQTTDAIAGALGRSFDVAGGSITIDGVDVREWPLDALRNAIVVAEHDGVLFEGSLRQNLSVADALATDESMHAALTVAAGADIVELLDGGLEGAVLERGHSLSGGQRQRVALARALLARPSVLVLVDPTSALDSYTESDIVDRLPAARRGSSTIVFTSSPALLAAADEVLFFEADQVVARGRHAQLLESIPAYRDVVVWDAAEGASA